MPEPSPEARRSAGPLRAFHRSAVNRALHLHRSAATFLGQKAFEFGQLIGYADFWRLAPGAESRSGPMPSAAAGREVAALPPLDGAEVVEILNSAIAAAPQKGTVDLPPKSEVAALAELLRDPPPRDDLHALDMLCTCFAGETAPSSNLLLLAVARNLTREFGRNARLPMASHRAWRMLDPVLYADELADQLATICDFVLDWQKSRDEFLILEFGETQLIRHLFEHLHPRRHGALLLKVMQFKALSTQRLGMVRRIPQRVEQEIAPMEPAAAIDYLNDSLALLDRLAQPGGFPPIVAEASAAHARLAAFQAARFSAATPQLSLGGPTVLPAPAAPAPAAPAPAAPVQAAPVQVIPVAAAASAPSPAPQVLPLAVPVTTGRANRRPTQEQKADAVIRVLRGESVEAVAASVGTRPETLARWQSTFIDAGVASMGQRRKADPAVEKMKADIADLRAAVRGLGAPVPGRGGRSRGNSAPKLLVHRNDS